MAGTNEENGRTGGRKRTVIAMGVICAALLAVGILCRTRLLDSLRLAEDTKEADAQLKDAEAKDGMQKNTTEESEMHAEEKNIKQNGKGKYGANGKDAAEKSEGENGASRYGTDIVDTDGPKSPGEQLRSGFFRQIAEIIWEKKPEDISEEEYANLTSIQIDRASGLVSFQLNHGYVGTFVCPEDLDADFSDLSFFRGLEWISVDARLNPDDLQGLADIFGIYSRNTVKEFAEILPCPEKITELGIEGDSSEKNLEGIEAFPNLQYLSVGYKGLEDISVLKQFPGLRGLILEDCSNLRDYGPLLALEDLEWLKISACKLESIDFVESMPKLVSLSLEDVLITGWAEGLFGIPTLRYLYLNGCRMGLDFDGVSVNETLEVLSLNGVTLLKNPAQVDGGQVSLSEHCDIFACFPNLKELHLVSLGLDDIGFVEKLPHLQYLDITGNPVRDMTPLEQLKELRGVGCGEREKWGDIFRL